MALRVGIIHTYYQDKGGEDVVFEMESALISDICNVETLIFKNKNGAAGLIQFVISIWNPFSTRKVKKFIHSFKPDVIHIHNLHFAAGPAVIRTIKRMGVPVVYTVHNYRLLCPSGTLLHNEQIFTQSVRASFPWVAVGKKVFRNSRILTFWLSLITYYHRRIGTWKMIDKYLVHTEFAKETHIDSSFDIPPQKYIVKPNFVMPVINNGFIKRDNVFLFVGRLSEEKGIRFLLDTFSNSDYMLKIAGSGPLKKNVLDVCKYAKNIKYLGALKKDAVEKEMKSCAALIFPSLWYEGMPMTLLEALSSGTPVIASKLGAMTSIIIDEYDGLLFEPKNQKDLLEKLNIWSNLNETKKNWFYENAKRTYSEHYTPEKNRELLLNVYKVKSKKSA